MENDITRVTIYTFLLLNIVAFCDSIVEEPEHGDSTCTGETCQSILKKEKMKYYLEKSQEYHAAHTDSDDEMSGDTTENEKLQHDDSGVEETQQSVYEFPKLTTLDPGNVGDTIEVELEEGHVYNMITRSVQPPVFEVPNFLSDSECNFITDRALKAGLNTSNLFGADVQEEFAKGLDLAAISRVVSYAPGGHYHAHIDKTDNADHLPCCFQTSCGDKEHTPDWAKCCRICRFITILYYLNEPEEGGETAFPLADMSDELVETGYLGKVERRSHHGGCDRKKGSKWIANNWIPGTTFKDRFKPSTFYQK